MNYKYYNPRKAALDTARELLTGALNAAVADGSLPEAPLPEFIVEIPADVKNGDIASNAAMAGARAFHKAPRQIAQAIVDHLNLEGSLFDRVEIAGPGFINLFLGAHWFTSVLQAAATEPEYGRTDGGAGKRYNVEFVSANPTGPMHMGNARGGVLGDALASVLDRAGYQVWREFYVNDAGNQIEKFANSIDARYQQLLLGEEQVAFPEDGYHGDDIKDLAKLFYEANGDKYLTVPVAERHQAMAEFGLQRNIPKMQEDLRRYGIEYDQWFFESELHESGYVAESVQKLTDRGYTYEKDGALWLKTSQILAEQLLKAGKKQEEIDKLELKDDVLRRANGFYTYFAADIAYHRNKLEKRGFDKVINVWGADHHGHVARLKGAMDALGLDGEHRLDIVLMQLVKLVRDGEVVRMSKRTGKAISLTDLLDEIPVDACRYFFNAKPETQMEFDLGLAVREDSENPVYYVQYAYARICTLLKALAAEGYTVPDAADVDFTLLSGETEQALIKKIASYSQVVRLAARDYDPSHINRYLTELAGDFHRF
ncbi:MAG: arginine--tRNA ligase, partial [Gemmiger qucibialis]|nr:arginine--tRNA ligase [Gemmiger qucibialis]